MMELRADGFRGTKRLVFLRPDGGYTIRFPAEEPLPGESEGMYLDRMALDGERQGWKRLPDVEHDAIPTSRRFREQWTHDGKAVAVDLGKARAVLLVELRAERNARLTASDNEKNKLDDVGTAEQKRALAGYRQALRDLPAVVASDLDRADTVEALERYSPTWPEKPA